MRSPVGEGKGRLLDALFVEFGEDGPSPNLSMRQVAERLGVHHTLLTYHFGSRTGLLSAVLVEARRRDNVVIAAFAEDLGFVDLFRAVWRFYADGKREERSRAFFHLAGLAVYERGEFEDFVADLHEVTRLLEAAGVRDGLASADAAQQALVATACMRGLLLQRLLDPSEATDAAAERFVTAVGSSAGERAVNRAR